MSELGANNESKDPDIRYFAAEVNLVSEFPSDVSYFAEDTIFLTVF
jgi:hypothetical protein